jgi:AcrR family transcriptional regulator
MSRVARKREAVRRRLIEAATTLIAEKGVEGLRLREISDAADISTGAFYSHFATKEQLVEAVVAERVRVATEAIIATASAHEDPAETVAVAHRLFLQLAVDEPELAWLIVRLDRGEALLETASLPQFGPVLERGIAAGRLKSIDIRVMVSFVVGATTSVMRAILEDRLEPDADVTSARILLRACGLDDDEAAAIASRTYNLSAIRKTSLS